jgi:hypothetical protein
VENSIYLLNQKTDMEEKLKAYVDGKAKYTPQMNIMMNCGVRPRDMYSELGEYIDATIDISKEPQLEFLYEQLEEEKKNDGIVSSIKGFFTTKRSLFGSVSIFFITGTLDDKALRKMFGEPIFHDEFGEGFDGEWNEENDDYDEPEIKESYASYFVNIEGVDVHIGYDHRGTNIELGIPLNRDSTDEEDHKEKGALAMKVFKALVDMYKEKAI